MIGGWIALMALFLLPRIADPLVGGRTTANGCRLISIVDGDTVSIWCATEGLFRARLTGYDTPEVFSPRCTSEYLRGVAATWYLRWLAYTSREQSFSLGGRDRYDRRLVRMAIDGQDVARLMTGAGYGRRYSGGLRGTWCK